MKSRGLQLAAGIACMVMIANLQYGWTLFVQSIHDRHGWPRAAIQVAFSIFVIAEAWLGRVGSSTASVRAASSLRAGCWSARRGR